jgi:hypothetical protein
MDDHSVHIIEFVLHVVVDSSAHSSATSGLSLMYPYGKMAGDTNASFADCDNGATDQITLTGFPYFATVQTKLFVSFRKQFHLNVHLFA